jgi:hypothetical protein
MCINSGHFTHKLNKSAKHFYVKVVSKMSRVYTSINSSKGMFNSYNSNLLALYIQFQIVEKLPCTTLFKRFLAKRPTQLWNVTIKRGDVTDVILQRNVISLFDCNNLLKIIKDGVWSTSLYLKKIWRKHGVICHNFASKWAEVPFLKIAFFRIKL